MNTQLIINKIKIAENIKTDSELAIFLEITKFTLSNWRKRNTIDYNIVLSKCKHMDFNLLFDENTDEIQNIEKSVPSTPDKVKTDNELLNFILEKYKDVVIENHNLSKENTALKDIINSSK